MDIYRHALGGEGSALFRTSARATVIKTLGVSHVSMWPHWIMAERELQF